MGRAPGLERLWRRWLLHQPRQLLPDLSPDFVDAADRPDRPWFAVPNNTIAGAVRINVVGREPQGIVEAGADFDARCDELAGALAELVNVDTGEPLVLSVTRGDALHRFSEDDPFPDLIIEWNRTAPIERVWSPRFGVIEVPRVHWRTGDHTPHGLLVALGPGHRAGRSRRSGRRSRTWRPPSAPRSARCSPTSTADPVAGLVADPGALGSDVAWTVAPVADRRTSRRPDRPRAPPRGGPLGGDAAAAGVVRICRRSIGG